MVVWYKVSYNKGVDDTFHKVISSDKRYKQNLNKLKPIKKSVKKIVLGLLTTKRFVINYMSLFTTT